MRKIATLTALLLALLVVAAPLALADAEGRAEKAKQKAADATADDDAAAEAKARGRANRPADADDDANATGGDKAARAGVFSAFRAKMAEWRAVWKESAAAVREACHADKTDRQNLTREERKDVAHCIRDGYHALFDALKADRKAWKDEVRAQRG